MTLGREERLEKIAKYDRMGWSQTRIAAELGVSQPQVCQDLKVVYERYRDSAQNAKHVELDRAVRRLEDVIEAAYDGWARSMEDAVRVTSEKAPPLPPKDKAPKGQPSGKTSTAPTIADKLRVVKETVVRTGQAGDARFLSIIKDAVAEICRLKGLYPTEDVAGKGGVPKEQVQAFWQGFADFFMGPEPKGMMSPEDEVRTLSGRVAVPEHVETRDAQVPTGQ